MLIDSALWTGLKDKFLPKQASPVIRTETIYVAVNYKRRPIYVSTITHYLARDARMEIAQLFHPEIDWHQGWKQAKAEGWRVRRAFIELEDWQEHPNL